VAGAWVGTHNAGATNGRALGPGRGERINHGCVGYTGQVCSHGLREEEKAVAIGEVVPSAVATLSKCVDVGTLPSGISPSDVRRDDGRKRRRRADWRCRGAVYWTGGTASPYDIAVRVAPSAARAPYSPTRPDTCERELNMIRAYFSQRQS
jgi:hypothetical protein